MIRSLSAIGAVASICLVLSCAGAAETPAITFGVGEGSPAGTDLGRIPHGVKEGEVRFDIVGGNDAGLFQLDRRTARLSVAAAGLDFESQPLHVLRVRVEASVPLEPSRLEFAADLLESGVDSDGISKLFVRTDEVRVHVRVTDVNEVPQIAEQRLTVVDDNGKVDGDVRIAAVDEDRNDGLRFDILAGGDAAGVEIDSRTGRLIVAPRSSVDENRVFTYPLTVQVTDRSGQADAATIYVRRVDVREPAPDAVEPALVVVESPVAETPAAVAEAPAIDTREMESPDALPEPEAPFGNAIADAKPESSESSEEADSILVAQRPAAPPVRTVLLPSDTIDWYWYVLAGFAMGIAVGAVAVRGRTASAPEKDRERAPAHPFDAVRHPPPRPIYVVPRSPDELRTAHPETAGSREPVEEQIEEIQKVVARATTPAVVKETSEKSGGVAATSTSVTESKPEAPAYADVTVGAPRSTDDGKGGAVAPVAATAVEQRPQITSSRDAVPSAEITRSSGASQAVSEAPSSSGATITPQPKSNPSDAVVAPAPSSAPRIDRDAVREELSSLRAVANEYARATFAQQIVERQARQSWMASAGCMAGLTVVGAMTVSFAEFSVLRSIGWLMLGGSVISFGFCLYYFKQIALHEGYTSADRRSHNPADLEMAGTMELADGDGEPA